ncbi:MAG: hemerythrin domain-containing protein, partial [Burkholderiales bacterium]
DQDWPALEKQYGIFLNRMKRHFAMEEEVLFPAFEHETGMTSGPTEMMRHEHQEMRGLFDQMQAAIAAGDADEYLGLAETLLVMMQQHNRKEEEILYRMMDQALASEAASLLARFDEVAA